MLDNYVTIRIKESTKRKIDNLKDFSNFKSISETLEFAVDFYQHRLIRSLNKNSIEKLFDKYADAIKCAKIMTGELDKNPKKRQEFENRMKREFSGEVKDNGQSR